MPEEAQSGHLAAQLRDLSTELPVFWLAAPVACPTLSVDGVHITARRDKDDCTFTINIGTGDADPTLDPRHRAHRNRCRLNGVPLYQCGPRPQSQTSHIVALPVPLRTDGGDRSPDDGEGDDGADRREAEQAG